MSGISKMYLLFIGFVITATLFSCTKICDEGYEGNRCDVEIREKFEGAWNASDNPGSLFYTDTISKGTGILDVLILRRFGTDTFERAVKASISGNTINIAKTKPDTSKIYIEGTGTLTNDNKTINWSYNLINSYDTTDVITPFTGVWTK